MGATLERTGPLVLPRKRKRSRSERAKKFNPQKALAALIEAARIDIGNHIAIDIANGDGVVVELPVANDAKHRRALVEQVTAASKHVDAVVHIVETDERPQTLVAILRPDVDLSAPSARFMLCEEMVNATRREPVDERAWRAVEAYDLLRGRVGDALALASALDDVVDAIPAVADKEQSRRLSRMIYFAGELRELLDEIVSEGEATAAALITSRSTAKTVWPADKPIPSFASAKDEERFWDEHEFEALERDDGWDEIDGPRPDRPPAIRGPSPQARRHHGARPSRAR